MRVAVVQLAVRPGCRTATLQEALRAIDTLAEVDPAPDLVILPAFSDVLTLSSGGEGISERCAGPTVEAIGLRARQWGIFISLGFAETGAGKPFVTAALLDRDGDVRLTHRQSHSQNGAGGPFDTGGDPVAADLLIGRVALLAGWDFTNADAWRGLSELNAGLVIGTGCMNYRDRKAAPDRESVHRTIADGAKRIAAWAAFADVTTGDERAARVCPGYSVIVGPDGQAAAAAEPFCPTTLWADLQLPAVETVQES